MSAIDNVVASNALFPRTQLVFRTIALLGSIAAIATDLDARVKINKTWGMVYIATIWTLCLDIPEIFALYYHTNHTPRFHIGILIILDFIAVGIMVLTFFLLALADWDFDGAAVYVGDPWREVCMWVLLGVGCTHFVLLIFDCVDCCLRRRDRGMRFQMRRGGGVEMRSV